MANDDEHAFLKIRTLIRIGGLKLDSVLLRAAAGKLFFIANPEKASKHTLTIYPSRARARTRITN